MINQRDGLPVPDQGTMIGGKGADGNFHPLLLGNDGSIAAGTSGSATSAKQDTQITAEQAILAKLPTVGTATTPGSNVLSVQRPAVTQVVSTALEASHVLKAGAGQLVQLAVFNSAVSAQFILIMNSTTVPANGAVTLLYPPIPIAAGTLIVLDFAAPLVASTGISVSNSSTGTFTKTIGSADCAFFAQIN